MTADPIVVALCANDRYLPGLKVTVASLLVHTECRDIEIHVLDTGLSDASWSSFNRLLGRISRDAKAFRHRPDLSSYAACPDLRGSHACYAILQIPTLVPRPRVLILDADVLVLRDVAELWHRDLDGAIGLAYFHPGLTLSEDCPWLASNDPRAELPYFNSGVLLFDLDEWRRRQIDLRIEELVRSSANHLHTYDQTVLNFVLAGEVAPLDEVWNTFAVGHQHQDALAAPDGVVVHITHNKPWLYFKNLPGGLLWLTFHDLFVSPIPALLRYGVLFRIRKLANLRSALRATAEGFLLQSPLTRRLPLRMWQRRSSRRYQAVWLERWLE